MAHNPIVAQTSHGMHPVTRSYPLLGGEVPRVNEFVHLDANGLLVRTVAADATPVLGLTEEGYSSTGAFEGMTVGRLIVTVFTTDLVLRVTGTRAPVAADVNKAYGWSRSAGGMWTLDETDTTATRWFVVDILIPTSEYLVKVLAAHRQSPE